MIKKYSNKTAYDADTRPNEDNVSLLQAEKVVIAERKNEETKFPEYGDLVCYDTDRKLHFIKFNDNFDFAVLPSNYTTVGVVIYRMGNQVLVCGDSAERKWVEVFLWKLSGYTLDGTDRTLTLTANSVSKEITYNATTDAEFAEQVNDALDGFAFGTHTYTCYVRDGVVVVQHNTYTTHVTMTATGVSITQWLAPELIANSYMHRYNGLKVEDGSIVNMNRALIYFHQDLSSTSFNPSTDVTSLQRGFPICLPAYLGTSQYQDDHCAFLRNYYGEGEEGWLRFMEAQKIITPSGCGIMGESHRDGKAENHKLVGQTYIDADGNEKALYPAIEYCANYGYDAEGVEAGNWFLPTVEQADLVVKDCFYPYKYVNGVGQYVAREDADTLNRMLYKIGFSAIRNDAGLWTISKSRQIAVWYYIGGYGTFGTYGYPFNPFRCIPCCLIDLRNLN